MDPLSIETGTGIPTETHVASKDQARVDVLRPPKNSAPQKEAFKDRSAFHRLESVKLHLDYSRLKQTVMSFSRMDFSWIEST
jgi:hypothetical protein